MNVSRKILDINLGFMFLLLASVYYFGLSMTCCWFRALLYASFIYTFRRGLFFHTLLFPCVHSFSSHYVFWSEQPFTWQ